VRESFSSAIEFKYSLQRRTISAYFLGVLRVDTIFSLFNNSSKLIFCKELSSTKLPEKWLEDIVLDVSELSSNVFNIK